MSSKTNLELGVLSRIEASASVVVCLGVLRAVLCEERASYDGEFYSGPQNMLRGKDKDV